MGKLVAGRGICDKGKYPANIDRVPSREYLLWKSMLVRCWEGGLFQTTHPAYIGCMVDDRFLKFQYFAEWCNQQPEFNTPDFVLDKDILSNHGKLYSPETCSFIPARLNKLLNHNRSNQGDWPVGVTWNKRISKFCATMALNGKPKHIGVYDSADDAFEAYRTAKLAEIHRQANLYKDQLNIKVYHTLLNYDIQKN